jgi:hypothetical protein
MNERQLSTKSRATRHWTAIAIVGAFVASTALGALLVAAPLGGIAATTPTVFGAPSCTITVNTETGQNNAIQTAINAYGPLSSASSPVTICIGPGTFPEQLTINDTTDLTIAGAGNTSTVLAASSVVVNGIDLDSGQSLVALAEAYNDSGLTIENLAIDGSTAGGLLYNECTPGFIGIYYANSSGTISGVSVSNVNNNGGCQTQLGIYANTGYFETNTITPQTVAVVDSTVSDYGKNGITCNDLGLTCTVTDNTVYTVAMPSGYAATNGIQFWGAAGSIEFNSVTGNDYTPGDAIGSDCFTTGTLCVYVDWSTGILVISSPASVTLGWNTLARDQVPIWTIGAPVLAEYNSIRAWGYYGMILDFNTSDVVATGATTYASAPYADVADDNSIDGQNVGILAYDVNATIDSNSFASDNVAVEVLTDNPTPSVDYVNDNTGDVNVSGALLGDVSSFSPGVVAVASAEFDVENNAFVNVSAPGLYAPSSGIAVLGSVADLYNNVVTGFDTGISAVATGDITAYGNVATGPTASTPSTGLYFFGSQVTATYNSASGFSWTNGPGWWPNSQSPGLFAQCAAGCYLLDNELDNNGIGIAVSSYAYGPFPAPGWPYAMAPSAGPIQVEDNQVTDSGAFGIALELNQETSSLTDAPTGTIIEGNTVDNTLSGAVGLMVDQGVYTISGNTFIGTSLTGASGASQPTVFGEGSIGTASIQVLDASDSSTVAELGSNTFTDTTVYTALLNVTSMPPYFAAIIGTPPMTAPGMPSVSATAIDSNQPLTVSGTIPTDGAAPYSWNWQVSVDGGMYGPATQCAANSGTNVLGGTTVTCAITGGTLAVGSYAFELQVSDGSTSPTTLSSSPSTTVAVASPLAPAPRPTVNRPALDVNQAVTVSGKLPTSGTSPYSWTWLISTDGGPFETATQCAANTGSGGLGGATVKCAIAGGTLTAGDYYDFELKVRDGASSPETSTSKEGLKTVTVSPRLTAAAAPTVSATKLDVDQALTVTDRIPSTGTAKYSWTWLVAISGGSYATASFCSADSGSGATAGQLVTCAVPGSTLTAGDHYAFKLKVSDGATVAETTTSPVSKVVFVHSALLPSLSPKVSMTSIAASQPLTVTAKLPTTGTSPYAWEWEVSVNGASLVESGYCTANTGSGGAAGATVTCSIPGSTLTAGDTYAFAIVVTDSATHSEIATSAESHTVAVT